MAESVIIRQATIEDIDELYRIEEAGFEHDRFDKKQFRHLITKANSTVLILIHNNNICGYSIMLWRKNSRRARLYSIAIDPQAHGRGLGGQLLRASEELSLSLGCNEISLEVRVDNKPAIHVYERHGYHEIKPLIGYYSDGANGMRMLKRL